MFEDLKTHMTARTYLGPSQVHGTGVFANVHYQPGDLIELYPILFVPASKVLIDGEHRLANYLFYGTGYRRPFLCLGHGSYLNDSDNPNTRVTFYRKEKLVMLSARTAIQAGEELFINYDDYA